MACGTGKTLAAMWISERLDAKRTLILVPSLSLLAQTLREWSANATEPFDFLAVCSDETVVGEDKFTQHTAELGLPVTTDPDLIAAAYEGRTPFDLAVADEAHRCAGRVVDRVRDDPRPRHDQGPPAPVVRPDSLTWRSPRWTTRRRSGRCSTA